MAKRKNKAPGFDASSTRYCGICRVDVKIGFGGEANWDMHTSSKNHRTSIPPKTTILSFFTKKTDQAESSGGNPTVQNPPSLLNTLYNHPVVPQVESHGPTIMDVNVHDSSSPDQSPAEFSMIEKLRLLTSRIPPKIPLGTVDDILAHFAGDAVVQAREFDDPRQMAEAKLNGLIGCRASVGELTKIIRRGPLGMDGLCDWLEACLSKLKIDPALLEGNISRLVRALEIICSETESTLVYVANTHFESPAVDSDVQLVCNSQMPSLATDTTAIHMETTGHDIDKDFRHFSSSTMSEKRGVQVGPEEFECTDPNCGVEEEMLTCDCPEYELQPAVF